MRATVIEVMGVRLGMVRPFMGGLLLAPAGSKVLHWTWGYQGAEEALLEAGVPGWEKEGK